MNFGNSIARLTVLATATLAGITVACACLFGAGEWVPFVAQRIVKIYKVSAGGKTLIKETGEVWLRDSSGSLYLRPTPMFGSFPPRVAEIATFFNASTGTTFDIDYVARTIRTSRKGKPLLPKTAASFESQMPGNRYIGQKTIDGVKCVGYRMVWGDSVVHTKGEPAGEAWFAPTLDYIALDSVMVDKEQGIEIDTNVVSIQPGQQPNPKLLQLPAGFMKTN